MSSLPAPAPSRVEEFLQKHLMTMLMALGSAYAGFVTGQAGSATQMSEIRRDIADLDKRLTAAEGVSRQRLPALFCMANTVDRLADKAGMTPRCEMGVAQ